jgi:hypothetical protein
MGQIWKKEVKKLMAALMSIKHYAQDGICSYMMFNTWSPSLSSEVNNQKLREGGSREINNIWANASAGREEIVSWRGGESSLSLAGKKLLEKLLEKSFVFCLEMKRIPPEKINLGYLVEMKKLQPELKRNLEDLASCGLLRNMFGLCFLPLASQSLPVLLPQSSFNARFKVTLL